MEERKEREATGTLDSVMGSLLNMPDEAVLANPVRTSLESIVSFFGFSYYLIHTLA